MKSAPRSSPYQAYLQSRLIDPWHPAMPVKAGEGYADRPLLKKPFKYDELAAILGRLKLAPVE